MGPGRLRPLKLHVEGGEVQVQEALRRGLGRRFGQLAAKNCLGLGPLALGLVNDHDVGKYLVIGQIELVELAFTTSYIRRRSRICCKGYRR